MRSDTALQTMCNSRETGRFGAAKTWVRDRPVNPLHDSPSGFSLVFAFSIDGPPGRGQNSRLDAIIELSGFELAIGSGKREGNPNLGARRQLSYPRGTRT